MELSYELHENIMNYVDRPTLGRYTQTRSDMAYLARQKRELERQEYEKEKIIEKHLKYIGYRPIEITVSKYHLKELLALLNPVFHDFVKFNVYTRDASITISIRDDDISYPPKYNMMVIANYMAAFGETSEAYYNRPDYPFEISLTYDEVYDFLYRAVSY